MLLKLRFFSVKVNGKIIVEERLCSDEFSWKPVLSFKINMQEVPTGCL
jgi:hypothetical protein